MIDLPKTSKFRSLKINDVATLNEIRRSLGLREYLVDESITYFNLEHLKQTFSKRGYEEMIFNRLRMGDTSDPVVSEMLRILQERGEL